MPIKSNADRLSPSRFVTLDVSNLNTSNALTTEKAGDRLDSNNHMIDNRINKTNLNRSNPTDYDDHRTSHFQTKQRTRRELGNRGYIKKMRKIPFLGIFCAIMYAFFMSTSVALLKIVPNLHPIAVLVYR